MARVDSENSTNTSPLSQVPHGLFEFKTPLLRIRDLVIAASMMAGSAEMPKEAGNALDALAQTILEEIEPVLEERTRLCQLASQSDGGSHD